MSNSKMFENFNQKRIAFVGNSFTFFGKCTDVNAFDGVDYGYFYQLAKALGDDVTVTNFTWGGASFWHKGDSFAQRALYEKMKELHPAYYNNPEGLPLDEFYCQDAVVLQQSGDRIAQTYDDAKLIMELFAPQTKFGFYITTYDAFHSFEPSFEAACKIRDNDGAYIPLGHIVDDIINGRTQVSGSEFVYNKNSFVVCREHDKFHPNTLTGYLTALCTYCAFTQKDLPCVDYSFVKPMSYEEFYTLGESNHAEIIASNPDMGALGAIAIEYCKKYNKK